VGLLVAYHKDVIQGCLKLVSIAILYRHKVFSPFLARSLFDVYDFAEFSYVFAVDDYGWRAFCEFEVPDNFLVGKAYF
jgi:hypothetical protein